MLYRYRSTGLPVYRAPRLWNVNARAGVPSRAVPSLSTLSGPLERAVDAIPTGSRWYRGGGAERARGGAMAGGV